MNNYIMKKILSYFFILIIVLGTGFFLGNFNVAKTDISNKSLLKLLNKCGGAINNDEYRDCISNRVVSIADNYSIERSLVGFESLLEEKPELMTICHDIAHKIGYELYKEFGDGSMHLGKKFCAYGYYHGIFQGYIEKNHEVIKYAYDICNKLDTDGILVECVHGIGHAAYHNSLDPMDAINICSEIPDDEFISACVNGSIMAYQSNIKADKKIIKLADCIGAEELIALGCVTNLVAYEIVPGLKLNDICNIENVDINKNCKYGYAKGISGTNCVSTWCLGSKDLNLNKLDEFQDLIESCASDTICSNAFGFMSFSAYKYQANDVCNEFFKAEYLSSCLAGYDKAKGCVDNFSSVVHHYRPCRLES